MKGVVAEGLERKCKKFGGGVGGGYMYTEREYKGEHLWCARAFIRLICR
jgi:hypothetical protein